MNVQHPKPPPRHLRFAPSPQSPRRGALGSGWSCGSYPHAPRLYASFLSLIKPLFTSASRQKHDPCAVGSYSSPGHADVRVDTHAYVHRRAFHGQRTFTRGKKSAISSISRVFSQNVCFHLTRKGSGKSACVPMWKGGGGGDFLGGGARRAFPSGATSHLFPPLS